MLENLNLPDTIERKEDGSGLNFYDRELNASVTPYNNGTIGDVNIVILKSGLVITNNTSPYLVIKVVSVSGNQPYSLEAVNAIYRHTMRSGNYTKLDQLNASWSSGQIWAGQAVTKVIPISKTYYYTTQSAGYAMWKNNNGTFTTAGNNWEEYDILLNKLGQPYPAWKNIDVHGFLNASMPDSTSWSTTDPAVNAALRQTFNSTIRDKYKTYYDQNYGYVNWSQPIEIHHIRPLQFGGDNSYNNLIPLWADVHTKFTFWFTYY